MTNLTNLFILAQIIGSIAIFGYAIHFAALFLKARKKEKLLAKLTETT